MCAACKEVIGSEIDCFDSDTTQSDYIRCNMKSQVLGLTAALVIVGVVSFAVGRSHNARNPNLQAATKADQHGDLKEDDPVLLTKIEAIERRLNGLELRQLALGDPASGAPKRDVSPSLDPGTYVQPDNPIESQARKHAEIATRLATETRDRSWASEAEGTLRNAIAVSAGDGAKYTISSMSCLTSLCSVELKFADITGALGTMQTFPHRVNGMAAFDFAQPQKEADDKYRVEYKFFRRGYPVPGEENTP